MEPQNIINFFDLQRKDYLQALKKDFVLLKKLIVIAMRKE